MPNSPPDASASTRSTSRWCSRRASTCASTATSGCSTTTSTRSSTRPRISPTSRTSSRSTPDEPFILHPGEFVLGSTYELVSLPDDVAARLEGKSSLGRLGLLTHSTAGFVDPGFSGHVTLELSNVATLPIKLWPGMKIGQLCFIRTSSPVENPYGSGHVRATGTRGSAARRRRGRSRTSTARMCRRPRRAPPATEGPARCATLAVVLRFASGVGRIQQESACPVSPPAHPSLPSPSPA